MGLNANKRYRQRIDDSHARVCPMESDQVRYSRAGDAFHYRWAARRCLRLIELNSELRCVTIERSREFKLAGEYAIDVGEYSTVKGGGEAVEYFQLKHSTVRLAKGFSFSELKPTLVQFAKRYTAAFLKTNKPCKPGSVKFTLITNRSISQAVKAAVVALRDNRPSAYKRKFEQATKLKGLDLAGFCAALSLQDDVGDYRQQKADLRRDMAVYLSGFVEGNDVDGLIALVIDRALPQSDGNSNKGEINQQDVLSRLGVTAMRQLFPAERRLENLAMPLKRMQHDDIFRRILAQSRPSIVHAAGGVGKSVVARQLADSLPAGSWGLVYDCFGAGNYRNPSEPRHRPRDALVQIANELAVAGLCRPLIVRAGEPNDSIFRSFLERLSQAIRSLRTVDSAAILAVFVDAADNAEMAAADAGETGFVRGLLREALPDGCRLVMLCRTERIDLLQPPSTVQKIELQPFNLAETTLHLQRSYPASTRDHAREFHRLTGGNPRVQAYALVSTSARVEEMLSDIGPTASTLDEQIGAQLRTAISRLMDLNPQIVAEQIDRICVGLATLPPYIPLEVLAKAAAVEIAAIQSFVSDLGRPLWVTDDAVQFRDEPTESWFRKTYGATPEQIESYIAILEPLTASSTYASKALPQLMHRGGQHVRLMALALSDELLPANNPVDSRNIRVYR